MSTEKLRRQLQRLRINAAIDSVGEYLAEIGLIDICWRKNRLGGACAGAGVVVMLGKNGGLSHRRGGKKHGRKHRQDNDDRRTSETAKYTLRHMIIHRKRNPHRDAWDQ